MTKSASDWWEILLMFLGVIFVIAIFFIEPSITEQDWTCVMEDELFTGRYESAIFYEFLCEGEDRNHGIGSYDPYEVIDWMARNRLTIDYNTFYIVQE